MRGIVLGGLALLVVSKFLFAKYAGINKGICFQLRCCKKCGACNAAPRCMSWLDFPC